jgi:membrane-bound metal-dependent hydrolase YbcI (DUF457 family)
MDWITHSAAGVFVAWALPRSWAVPKAVPAAVAGALLPDVDLFIEPLLKPGSAFDHRAFTHSFVGVAVLAPMIALVPWSFNRKQSYARLVALSGMGILSHIVLDLPTEIGAKIFYPFSRKTIFVDWLGHIDFTLLLVSLFVLLAAWTYSKREGAMLRGILFTALLASVCWWLFAKWPIFAFRRNQRFTLVTLSEQSFHTVYPLVLGGILLVVFVAFSSRGWGFRQSRAVFGRIGVAAFSFYLLVCAIAQWIALRQIDHFAEDRKMVVLARAAARADAFSFAAPLRWNGAVLAPDGVYDGEITPFSGQKPVFRFYPTATENPFVAKSRSIPDMQGFLSEARFPVSCYQTEGPQHVVEFYDHGGAGEGVARVTLNERQEVLAMRWIPISEYTSKAQSSPATVPGTVSPGITFRASSTPCFLR